MTVIALGKTIVIWLLSFLVVFEIPSILFVSLDLLPSIALR